MTKEPLQNEEIASTFKSRPYDLAVDTINQADLDELIAWMREYPRLTMWKETARFEAEWAEWLGVQYAVMVNSGSSADLLMYAALDVSGRAGDRKIIVPATGWSTTIAPALQFGWQAFMCESASDTYGFDLDALTSLMERERPETVIMVHVLGVPNRMAPIVDLKEKYGFNLLEDCCAAHGSRHQGRKVGTFGDMSSFSFYYGHHMSTVEGGMVCTNDKELYHHLLMLRSHGWLKDLPEELASEKLAEGGMDPFHTPFMFAVPGFNVRSTDMNAKLGRIQLRRLDGVVEQRRINHEAYRSALRGVVDFARPCDGDDVSSISFCAVAESSAQRRTIVEALDREQIDTRIFTAGNLGRHPFWVNHYGIFSAPTADRLYDGGFFLPNNQALTEDDIHKICDVVRGAVG